MNELVPCVDCQRHIRSDESECPFCSVRVVSSAKLGGVRSVLLAGAVAGASALGCSDERPATKAPPPVEVKPQAAAIDAAAALTIDAAAPAPADASTPDAGTPDAAVVKKRKKKKKVQAKENRGAPVGPVPQMPYGAPPMRKRLV